MDSSGGSSRTDGRSGAQAAGGGRSALISDLVAQLKRGDITKSELFSRLQQLQGGGIAAASVSAGSATNSATSVSVPASTSTSPTPIVNPRAGDSVPQAGQQSRGVSPPTTVSSVQSSTKAATAAVIAESAGFFSAYDRQAIIQKIADERRRRVEEVRQSLTHTERQASTRSSSSVYARPQSSSSADLSTSADFAGLVSSAVSQKSFENHPEHNSSDPPISGGTDSARAMAPGGGFGAALGPTAWKPEQGKREQQLVSETPPSSKFDASFDEFPFPSGQDQQQHNSGETEPNIRSALGGGAKSVDGIHAITLGNRRSSERFLAAAPSSTAFVGDTTSENSKLSQRGSTRISHKGKNGNKAAHADSRRTRNRRKSSSNSQSDGPSSPCGSENTNRPLRSNGAGTSGHGTSGSSVGLGGSSGRSARYVCDGGNPREICTRVTSRNDCEAVAVPSTSSHNGASGNPERDARSRFAYTPPIREPSTSPAGSWANEDEVKASAQGRGGGGGARAVLLRQGVHAATGQKRQPEHGAAGRSGWVGHGGASEVNCDDREDAGQPQLAHPPQRGEWSGGLRVGSSDDERRDRPQASEKMVDEDAYRFRSFSEERARRGEELVRRELMSECTFRPKIKGLPQSYGAINHDDTPFLQRVNQWQRDKEKFADARKADTQDKELEECTFTPRVNSVSRRAARSRRQALGENHLTIDDRLYDESVRRDMERSHLAAEQAAREEERLHEECTFTPDFPTKRAAEAAAAAASAAGGDGEHRNDNDWGHQVPRGRSRYRQAAAAVAAAVATGGGGGGSVWGAGRRANGANGGGGGGGGARHWELEPCTFTPTIIGARKGMDQAQQYLQYDVVDRLTGAAFRPPDSNDYDDTGSEEGEELCREGGGTLRASHRYGFGFGVAGVGGRMGGAEYLGFSSPARGSGGGDGEKGAPEEPVDRGPRQQREQSPRRQGTGGAFSDTSSSFHAFLSRQNKLETDKLKHIEQIQAMRQNTFRPEICAESKKIHMESNKGDFLQRVARDAARKEHESVRQKAAGLHDPECTFKPQITARSATLQARSVVELSRGDQLKRETTQRLTRLRAEQELLADTTFRPRINADGASRMAVSKLKIVSDPDSYIANVETIRRRKEQTVVRGAIEKAAKEVEGCTFTPVTTECPAYIKRIAKSISASKALQGAEGGKGKKQQAILKPDWK